MLDIRRIWDQEKKADEIEKRVKAIRIGNSFYLCALDFQAWMYLLQKTGDGTSLDYIILYDAMDVIQTYRTLKGTELAKFKYSVRLTSNPSRAMGLLGISTVS